jgi:hypothetical protein
MVLAAVKADPVCRLLVSVPGVGPVTALAFRTAVEDPTRFAKSSLVGAHFGLTPRKYASGETDRNGGISRCGDRMMRSLLCEAANVLLTRVQRWSWLKRWGVEVARRRGKVRAQVAVARRLAVIMHRMWVDGTPFRRTRVRRYNRGPSGRCPGRRLERRYSAQGTLRDRSRCGSISPVASRQRIGR